jgi:hypothetical protein
MTGNPEVETGRARMQGTNMRASPRTFSTENPVKPLSHVSLVQSTTSAWHSSFTQSAKLDRDGKKEAPAKPGLFSLQQINRLERGIYP